MMLNCNYTVSGSDLGKKCTIAAKLTASDAIPDYKFIIIGSYIYCGVYFLNIPPIILLANHIFYLK